MSGLESAREALQHGDWRLARQRLDDAGPAGSGAEGLELRAQAAYGDGDLEAAVTAWEDLHALLVDHDPVGAARAAAMIAMFLMMDTGLMAPVRGWLRRAESLLEGRPETPAHALIAMVRTYERFMCGDLAEARAASSRAVELGERHGVEPAVVIGRVAGARVTIFEGRVEEGLAQLDEIATLLMSGAVDPLTTGMMYCELICAAQGLVLPDRAGEWTEVMEHWRHGAAFGGINGRCRVHRAEMLRMTGPCDLAEQEALSACDELRPWMRREFGWPLAELGNIRLRRGDLDGAEEAFVAAHEHAWSPHPGLALVRLARGDAAGAATLIEDAIAHPFRIPSKERPPFGDLSLVPLLEAQVEIAIEAGRPDTARRAADRLTRIADEFGGRWLEACAALARARVAIVDGALDEAVDLSRTALAAWTDVGAPYEAATARMVLGAAQRRAGNDEGARMEFEAAQRSYAAFGAEGRAELARHLAADGEPPPGPGVDHRSTATFRLEGGLRTVGIGAATVQLRDLKGFRYLERMLSAPHREFHVLDLVAVEAGTLPSGPTPALDDRLGVTTGDRGIPVLDEQAREAYRRRLLEVEDDIEEATQRNDLGRVELAERDREYLIAELRRAVGLGGRHRAVGSDAERARTAVTRSVRYALARLAEHAPDVAAHLENTVRTGTYCSYRPETRRGFDWIV